MFFDKTTKGRRRRVPRRQLSLALGNAMPVLVVAMLAYQVLLGTGTMAFDSVIAYADQKHNSVERVDMTTALALQCSLDHGKIIRTLRGNTLENGVMLEIFWKL